MMYRSHSNWHPASPEGNAKRIHDSYPNNSLRLQIYWGKLPPPDSQADSCEEEEPSRKQINKNNRIHPRHVASSQAHHLWSLFYVCLLWVQPCWLVLTNCIMVRRNNFVMPAALLVSQLLRMHTTTRWFSNSPIEEMDKWRGYDN